MASNKIRSGTSPFFRPENLPFLFLLLGMLFVPECDDCYFVFWKYSSWQNFVLTKPIMEGALVVGVPANGRYLGNLLGVLQGKLYFTPVGFIRGILMGGAIAVFVWLLGEWFLASENCRKDIGMAFALVVLAPRGIWQEVYSWGAGLVNYLLPMVGILFILKLANSHKRDLTNMLLLFLLSFSCCLFMEPVTILLVICGGVLFLYSLFGHKDSMAMSFVPGVFLGAIVMFCASGYRQVGSDLREVGVNLIFKNMPVVLTETLIRPVAPSLLISVLMIWLLKKQGDKSWKLWAGMLTPIHLVCLINGFRDNFLNRFSVTTLYVFTAVAMALVWSVMLFRWKGGQVKMQIIGCVSAICVLNGPLLFVSIGGARNFFASYVMLLLISALLWTSARKQGFPPLKKIWIGGFTVFALLMVVYGINCIVYHKRIDSARTQVLQGEKELTLPLLPFDNWVINETTAKGDISYVVYYETPWDVSFHFLPYPEFYQQMGIQNQR